MKLSIIGLPGSGKTRVFGALTGRDMTGVPYSREPLSAIVKVPDERLDFLYSKFSESKKIHATFDLVDFGPAPGRKEAAKDVGAMKESELMGNLRSADAFLVVLRAFESDSVAPPLGKIDPFAEWEELEASFLLSDAALVERRLTRVQKIAKRGIKAGSPVEVELHLLERLKAHLDELKNISEFEFKANEKNLQSSFQFLSEKPCLALLNVDENALDSTHPAEAAFPPGQAVMKISAQVEMELAQLEGDDKDLFMRELGVTALMKDRVIAAAYEALGLISFFTIGGDEVRAWPITKGTVAVEAAGKVHTDIARGFIRAEVFDYNDFHETPSEKELRSAGKARLEGKEYVVRDGDMVDFRFNV